MKLTPAYAIARNTLSPLTDAMLATRRHSWEQGVVMQALDAIGARDTMVALAYEAVTATAVADGRVGVTPGPDEGSATDSCACGIPLARAHALTGDGVFAQALDGLDRWATHGLPRRADGVAFHETRHNRIWVDSFFMLPPFLADRGHMDDALHQINGFWETLYDPMAGLLHHRWDDDLGAYDWPRFWATGHGWALAGLTQVIQRVAEPEPRAWLVDKVTMLLDALAPLQTDDGLWHNEVDRPDTFVDSTGACFIAYAILTGVKEGWLSSEYEPMATRTRDGARRRVGPYGFLEQVPGAPFFESPGVSAEAQAAYLLMQAAGGMVLE